MDGGHHRLAAGFDALADLGQGRRHGRLAELADVGPGNEGPAVAHDQHRLDMCIGLGLGDRRHQPLAHRSAQGVDGWVVDADELHAVLQG